VWQQGHQIFTKLMTDSLVRWQSFADQARGDRGTGLDARAGRR